MGCYSFNACPFLSPPPIPRYANPSAIHASGSTTFRPSTITGRVHPHNSFTRAGSSPRYSLCPAKTTTASAPESTPSKVPREPRRGVRRRRRIHPGIVHGKPPPRRARRLTERLRRRVPGVVGVVDERPAEERNLRTFQTSSPLCASADSVKCSICSGMKSLMPRARV
jgi:hypothetical protein